MHSTGHRSHHGSPAQPQPPFLATGPSQPHRRTGSSASASHSRSRSLDWRVLPVDLAHDRKALQHRQQQQQHLQQQQQQQYAQRHAHATRHASLAPASHGLAEMQPGDSYYGRTSTRVPKSVSSITLSSLLHTQQLPSYADDDSPPFVSPITSPRNLSSQRAGPSPAPYLQHGRDPYTEGYADGGGDGDALATTTTATTPQRRSSRRKKGSHRRSISVGTRQYWMQSGAATPPRAASTRGHGRYKFPTSLSSVQLTRVKSTPSSRPLQRGSHARGGGGVATPPQTPLGRRERRRQASSRGHNRSSSWDSSAQDAVALHKLRKQHKKQLQQQQQQQQQQPWASHAEDSGGASMDQLEMMIRAKKEALLARESELMQQRAAQEQDLRQRMARFTALHVPDRRDVERVLDAREQHVAMSRRGGRRRTSASPGRRSNSRHRLDPMNEEILLALDQMQQEISAMAIRTQVMAEKVERLRVPAPDPVEMLTGRRASRSRARKMKKARGARKPMPQFVGTPPDDATAPGLVRLPARRVHQHGRSLRDERPASPNLGASVQSLSSQSSAFALYSDYGDSDY